MKKKKEDLLDKTLEKALDSENSKDYLNYIKAATLLAEKEDKKNDVFKDFICPLMIASIPTLAVEIVHDIFLRRQTVRILAYEKDGVLISSPGKGLLNTVKLK